MPTVPYHVSKDDLVLTLRWVNSDRESVEDVETDFQDSVDHSANRFESKIRTFNHFGTTTHCLYTAEVYPRRYSDMNLWEHAGPEDRLFVDTVLDAFSSIEDEWISDGMEISWYKKPEVEKLFDLLDNVEFQQPVAVVGGELLSCFISTHPLPNGNHRVGMSLLETYLNTYDPEFSMPTTGVTGEWFDWAKEFVYNSKTLMTLARKCELLRTLRDYGCDGVVRDERNVLLFDEYDLDLSNPFEHYANRVHREESIGFVHGVLDRTNNHELIATEDNGYRAFIDSLSA